MNKGRLEAFSDGVLAVIITIMVLEMKSPHEPTLAALRPVIPVLLTYLLSFVYVAIYWNNHHHFFRLVPHVGGAVMWANLNLLFWLSLIPFTTAWMDEHVSSPVPVAVYGASLLLCAVSWYAMQATIVWAQGPASPLRQAIGPDLKGKLSSIVYLIAMLLAFVAPILAYTCYAAVAMWWLVPDRRVEAALSRR